MARAISDGDRSAERRLASRIAAGDAEALAEAFDAHAERLFAVVYGITGSVSDAEDVVQDVFVALPRRLATFRGESSLGTWLHRVAVNVVLGRMRKSRRDQDRIRAVSDVAPPRETVADDGEARDLARAIDELPSGARHVFVLHAVYGYSHGETGEMLGIAEGTSKAQLSRARRLLAQLLKMEKS